jgi:hypothetical protein
VPLSLARVSACVSVSRVPHRSSIGRKARGGREAVSWLEYIKSVSKSFAPPTRTTQTYSHNAESRQSLTADPPLASGQFHRASVRPRVRV